MSTRVWKPAWATELGWHLVLQFAKWMYKLSRSSKKQTQIRNSWLVDHLIKFSTPNLFLHNSQENNCAEHWRLWEGVRIAWQSGKLQKNERGAETASKEDIRGTETKWCGRSREGGIYGDGTKEGRKGLTRSMQYVLLFNCSLNILKLFVMKLWSCLWQWSPQTTKGKAKEKSRIWRLSTLPFAGINEACLLSGFYGSVKCQVPGSPPWQERAVSLPLLSCILLLYVNPHLSPVFPLQTTIHWRASEWSLEMFFTPGAVISTRGLIIRSSTPVAFLELLQTFTIGEVIAYRRKLSRLLQLRGSLGLSSQAGTKLCMSAGITVAKLTNAPGLDWPSLVLGNYLASLWAPCSSKNYSWIICRSWKNFVGWKVAWTQLSHMTLIHWSCSSRKSSRSLQEIWLWDRMCRAAGPCALKLKQFQLVSSDRRWVWLLTLSNSRWLWSKAFFGSSFARRNVSAKGSQ